MSVVGHPNDWVCDFCGDKVSSYNRPNMFRQISVSVSDGGFKYSSAFDACHKCFPSEYLTDPPSKKPIEKTFMRKIMDKIYNKRKTHGIRRVNDSSDS